MDVQFYGANCLTFIHKSARIVVDDTLKSLGAKSITKSEDVSLFTGGHDGAPTGRLGFDFPGEYEVGDVSVTGIAARAALDESGKNATMFKLVLGETTMLVTGHINPDLSESQLEAIGLVDVLFVPVGGTGYTIDAVGALKLIKAIEPKLIVPTHYADSALKFEVPQQELATVLNEMAMEPRETVSKLKYKPGEASDVTQLIVLEKS